MSDLLGKLATFMGIPVQQKQQDSNPESQITDSDPEPIINVEDQSFTYTIWDAFKKSSEEVTDGTEVTVSIDQLGDALNYKFATKLEGTGFNIKTSLLNVANLYKNGNDDTEITYQDIGVLSLSEMVGIDLEKISSVNMDEFPTTVKDNFDNVKRGEKTGNQTFDEFVNQAKKDYYDENGLFQLDTFLYDYGSYVVDNELKDGSYDDNKKNVVDYELKYGSSDEVTVKAATIDEIDVKFRQGNMSDLSALLIKDRDGGVEDARIRKQIDEDSNVKYYIITDKYDQADNNPNELSTVANIINAVYGIDPSNDNYNTYRDFVLKANEGIMNNEDGTSFQHGVRFYLPTMEEMGLETAQEPPADVTGSDGTEGPESPQSNYDTKKDGHLSENGLQQVFDDLNAGDCDWNEFNFKQFDDVNFAKIVTTYTAPSGRDFIQAYLEETEGHSKDYITQRLIEVSAENHDVHVMLTNTVHYEFTKDKSKKYDFTKTVIEFANNNPDLKDDALKQVFNYNPDTGLFNNMYANNGNTFAIDILTYIDSNNITPITKNDLIKLTGFSESTYMAYSDYIKGKVDVLDTTNMSGTELVRIFTGINALKTAGEFNKILDVKGIDSSTIENCITKMKESVKDLETKKAFFNALDALAIIDNNAKWSIHPDRINKDNNTYEYKGKTYDVKIAGNGDRYIDLGNNVLIDIDSREFKTNPEAYIGWQ